ncbi:MAG TPA: hypothetical protein VGG92_13085 [Caulobacteraceae bacterium]
MDDLIAQRRPEPSARDLDDLVLSARYDWQKGDLGEDDVPFWNAVFAEIPRRAQALRDVHKPPPDQGSLL